MYSFERQGIEGGESERKLVLESRLIINKSTDENGGEKNDYNIGLMQKSIREQAHREAGYRDVE